MAGSSAEKVAWQAVGLVSGLVAAQVTRKVLSTVWKQVEGEEPPAGASNTGKNWTEAVVWAVASGAALAVSSLIARRVSAEAWKAATGSYPEGADIAEA